jgi:hypothetical protein
MFRFTIRELVLLMVIAAVSAGWLSDHWRMSRALAESRHNARELLYRLLKLEAATFG